MNDPITKWVRRGATAFGFLKAAIENRRAKRKARRAKREGPLPDDRGEFLEDDKETSMLNGKLTYSAFGGLFAFIVSRVLNVEITDNEIAELAAAALVLVGIYGRWRATRAA